MNMKRQELLQKVKYRRSQLGITFEELSKLSGVNTRTMMRFFAGDDAKLSTLEKINSVLGLDLAGNEVVDIQSLLEKRAKLQK